MANQKIFIENPLLHMTINVENQVKSIELLDTDQKVSFADNDYCYSLDIVSNGQTFRSNSLIYEGHEEPKGKEERNELQLTGHFEFETSVPLDIALQHQFAFHSRRGFFEESIQITNRGPQPCQIAGDAFGFRKTIYQRKEERWADRFEDYALIPVPHRRRFGHRVDRKLKEYRLNDLLPHMWENMVDIGGPERPKSARSRGGRVGMDG